MRTTQSQQLGPVTIGE
jgi:hypothetical protein